VLKREIFLPADDCAGTLSLLLSNADAETAKVMLIETTSATRKTNIVRIVAPSNDIAAYCGQVTDLDFPAIAVAYELATIATDYVVGRQQYKLICGGNALTKIRADMSFCPFWVISEHLQQQPRSALPLKADIAVPV
jgi:hypothetical protein